MGNIYIGTSKVKNLYLGSALKAKKIYLGTTMVWQSAIPIARPTSAQTNVTKSYTGGILSNDFSMEGVEYVRGDTSGTSGGIYTAYYRPDEEHIWEDTEDRAEIAVVLTVQYVWNKWNTLTTYSLASTYVTKGNLVEAGDFRGLSFSDTGSYNASFDTSTGQFSVNGSSGYIPYSTYTVAFRANEASTSREYSHPWSTYSNRTPKVYRVVSMYEEEGTAEGYYNYDFYGTLGIGCNCGSRQEARLYKRYGVGSHSKGSTSYGTVSNVTNSSAYPSNGMASDGYWYVQTW